MNHFKQNILAAGVLVLSMGSSVALGHFLSAPEPQVHKPNTECIQVPAKPKTVQIKHSYKVLIPQLG